MRPEKIHSHRSRPSATGSSARAAVPSADASAHAATADPVSTPHTFGRRALLLGAAGIGGAFVAASSMRPAHAASAGTTSRTQTIAAFPLARDIGDNRTFQALSASDLNPSGFYLAPKKTLDVTVKQSTAEEYYLVVGAPDAEIDEDKRTPREYALKIGENSVKDPYGGPVYWKVIGEKGQLTATLGEQAERMPFFIHGSTTEAEFQDQLDTRDVPYAELVSAHALVTVQAEAARRFRGEDHATLMATFEEVIAAEDALAGYSDTEPIHQRLDHRYHLITRAAGVEGIGAYATHGHTLYPAPIQDRLLTVEGLRMRGWGIYHELGHQHQQTVYKPTDLTESTVNWYSLAVNRAFAKYGQAPRLHVPENSGEAVWTTAPPKIGSDGVDFVETFTIMETLVMYEQLRLVYGDELFQDVHTLVREEQPEPGEWEDNDHRLGMLVLYLSKAAGNDLRAFTDAWGVHYGAEFDDLIDELDLPAPEEDLTAVRDDEGLAAFERVMASSTLRRANDLA